MCESGLAGFQSLSFSFFFLILLLLPSFLIVLKESRDARQRVFPLGHWLCVSVDATRTQERGEEEEEKLRRQHGLFFIFSFFVCVFVVSGPLRKKIDKIQT